MLKDRRVNDELKSDLRKWLIGALGAFSLAFAGNAIGLYFNVQTLQRQGEAQQITLTRVTDAVNQLSVQSAKQDQMLAGLNRRLELQENRQK